MTKPDILMVEPLAAPAERALEEACTVHRLFEARDEGALVDSVGTRLRGVAASYLRRMDRDFIDRLPKLEIIAGFGVGYDYIDAAYAAKKGVVVTNTPDVLTEEVADLALGLVLATVREIPQANRYLRDGNWPTGTYRLTASLRDRRVGILGLGRIGKAVARRCEAFGLKVSYHGRQRQADVAYRYYDKLVDLARDVDLLIIVAPGGAATHNLVDVEVLRALGPNGIIVNVSRGSLVDEPALIEALQKGTIAAAGLDVFAQEPDVPEALRKMENVVLLPHVGSGSVKTRAAMAKLLADNLTSWFSGKGPITPVPETPWRR